MACGTIVAADLLVVNKAKPTGESCSQLGIECNLNRLVISFIALAAQYQGTSCIFFCINKKSTIVILLKVFYCCFKIVCI